MLFNAGSHAFHYYHVTLLAPFRVDWLDLDDGIVNFSFLNPFSFGFFLFYLTLDVLFAIVFLVFGFGLTVVAGMIAELSLGTSATVAAVMFFGGYAAQFIGTPSRNRCRYS